MAEGVRPGIPLVAARYWLLLLWLLLVPVGAAVLWAITALAGLRASHPLTAPLAGGGAVVLLVGITMVLRWRPLVRVGVVDARHPDAVVVDALRTAGDDDVFARVIGTAEPSLTVFGCAIAVDGEGMHVYLGGRDAVERLHVSWPHLLEVTETRVMPRARWVPGLAVRFTTTAGPVTLPVAPVSVSGTALSSAAVRRLHAAIEARRPR